MADEFDVPSQHRRAYSYIRFSTPEQARGRSKQRQIERTEAYCAKRGCILDQTMTDEGVSAFRGKNRKVGALAGFLKAVESGDIPAGSVLIIESLDRLSREKVRLSQSELLQLINQGIEIVTLIDEQVYSAETLDQNPTHLLMALVAAMRAHDESATKSSRLIDVWGAKRKAIVAGSKIRQRLPGWLTWSNRDLVPIPERVVVVRGIFVKRQDGWGRRRIVADLNARGVPVFGRSHGGWNESYVAKLLTSRALLGEFQPHRLVAGRNGKRTAVGDVVKGYFPAVISPELWHSAQSAAPGRSARRGRPGGNLFTGLVYDPEDAPMHLERKGADAWVYLVTALAYRRPGRPTYRWLYPHFESLVLRAIVEIDWSCILGNDDETAAELRREQTELSELQVEEIRTRSRVDAVAQLLLDDFRQEMRDSLKAKSDEASTQLASVRERMSAVSGRIDALERSRRDLIEESKRVSAEMGKDLKDPAVRTRLAREIRNLVKRVEVFPNAEIPGLEDLRDRARGIAESLLTGNQGLIAKRRRRLVGAVVLEFSNGRKLVVWSTYRTSARFDRLPRIVGYSEIGYDRGGRKLLGTLLDWNGSKTASGVAKAG